MATAKRIEREPLVVVEMTKSEVHRLLSALSGDLNPLDGSLDDIDDIFDALDGAVNADAV